MAAAEGRTGHCDGTRSQRARTEHSRPLPIGFGKTSANNAKTTQYFFFGPEKQTESKL